MCAHASCVCAVGGRGCVAGLYVVRDHFIAWDFFRTFSWALRDTERDGTLRGRLTAELPGSLWTGAPIYEEMM